MDRKELLSDLEDKARNIAQEIKELYKQADKHLKSSQILEETNKYVLNTIGSIDKLSTELTDVVTAITQVNTPKIIDKIDSVKTDLAELSEHEYKMKEFAEQSISMLNEKLLLLNKKILLFNSISFALIVILIVLHFLK